MNNKVIAFCKMLDVYFQELHAAGRGGGYQQNKIDKARLAIVQTYESENKDLEEARRLILALQTHILSCDASRSVQLKDCVLEVPANCTLVIGPGAHGRIEQKGFGQAMPRAEKEGVVEEMVSRIFNNPHRYTTEPDRSRAAYDAARSSGTMDDECRRRSCKDD